MTDAVSNQEEFIDCTQFYEVALGIGFFSVVASQFLMLRYELWRHVEQQNMQEQEEYTQWVQEREEYGSAVNRKPEMNEIEKEISEIERKGDNKPVDAPAEDASISVTQPVKVATGRSQRRTEALLVASSASRGGLRRAPATAVSDVGVGHAHGKHPGVFAGDVLLLLVQLDAVQLHAAVSPSQAQVPQHRTAALRGAAVELLRHCPLHKLLHPCGVLRSVIMHKKQ